MGTLEGLSYRRVVRYEQNCISSIKDCHHFLTSCRVVCKSKPAIGDARLRQLEDLYDGVHWLCIGYTLKCSQPPFVELLPVVFLKDTLLEASILSPLAMLYQDNLFIVGFIIYIKTLPFRNTQDVKNTVRVVFPKNFFLFLKTSQ